ncbi:MAG: pentapeptide repeat-containing protein, partial [Candidatus Kariarchaeaceae archaeon]
MNIKRILINIALVLAVLVIITIIALALHGRYILGVWPDWTGFGEYIGPDLGGNKEFRYAKTLWDWLGLLVIPAILVLGAWGFDQLARSREQRIATDQQKEDALQKYLDKMAELLLDKELLLKKPNDPVVDIAQVRTVTTLKILDKERRSILFQFLRDSNLADFILVNASLAGIDLSNIDLSSINLTEADLRNVNLERSRYNRETKWPDKFDYKNMFSIGPEANLNGKNLSNFTLIDADLQKTKLNEAELNDANLSGADLTGAELTGADLTNVD